MKRDGLHIAALLICLVFIFTNTGFTVFRHFCNTSLNTHLSIIFPGNCGMEEATEDCCLPESRQKKAADDCCDEDATFAKFQPEGKTETEVCLLSGFFSFEYKYPVLTLSGWQPTLMTEAVRLQAHPPEPKEHLPPYNSDFIISLSIMLC